VILAEILAENKLVILADILAENKQESSSVIPSLVIRQRLP
jgi:hypothetical protein